MDYLWQFMLIENTVVLPDTLKRMNNPEFYVDYTTSVKVNPLITEKYKSIIEKYISLKNKKVLDIGCGTGRLAIHIGKFVNHWYGIDIAPESIEIARKNIKNLKLEDKVEFKIGSFTEIPFDDKFDIIISSNSLHFESNKYYAFENVYNSLKNNSYFIIFEPTPTPHGWFSDKLNKKSPNFNLTFFNKKVEALNKSYAAIKSQNLFEIVDKFMPKTNGTFQGNQYYAILRKVE